MNIVSYYDYALLWYSEQTMKEADSAGAFTWHSMLQLTDVNACAFFTNKLLRQSTCIMLALINALLWH